MVINYYIINRSKHPKGCTGVKHLLMRPSDTKGEKTMITYKHISSRNKTQYRKAIWKYFVRENYNYFGIDNNDDIKINEIQWIESSDNYIDIQVTKNGVTKGYGLSFQEMNEQLDQFDALDNETKTSEYDDNLETFLYKNLKYYENVEY